MSAVAEFFKRLRDVTLLFWELRFKYFDALPMFAATLVAIGADAVLDSKTAYGATRAVVLQVVLYVIGFLFCYIWRPFRRHGISYVDAANNMICLAISISFISCLIALLIKTMLTVSPLAGSVGEVIRKILSDLQILPWDSVLTLAILIALFSYVMISINTIYVCGGAPLRRAIFSSHIVPMATSLIMSTLASLIVIWPIFETLTI